MDQNKSKEHRASSTLNSIWDMACIVRVSGQTPVSQLSVLWIEVDEHGWRYTYIDDILGKRNVSYIVQCQNKCCTMNSMVFTWWLLSFWIHFFATQTPLCLMHIISLTVCKTHTIHRTTFILILIDIENIPLSENIIIIRLSFTHVPPASSEVWTVCSQGSATSLWSWVYIWTQTWMTHAEARQGGMYGTLVHC